MTDNKEESTEAPHQIGELCKQYIRRIDSMSSTLPFIMQFLIKQETTLNKQFDEFVKDRATDVIESENNIQYKIRIEDKKKHDNLQSTLGVFQEALSVTPASFLVSLVSAYDAYLGSLIRALYNLKPELLKTSERALTLSQLLELGSIEAARESIIEKEVETILRKSHAEQFECMEKLYSVPLRKGLECWPCFIEVTERRNLFVHADGVVGSQYLKVCSEHGIPSVKDIVVGSRLHVQLVYFKAAANCLSEIGIKLAHVLWRKLDSKTRNEADSNLTEIIYDYLVKRRYVMAANLSDFAVEVLKSHASDQNRRIFIINRAIAYKFQGKAEDVASMLDTEDWSSTADKFQIAVAVLRDDFNLACQLMKEIGKDRIPGPLEYQEWPVFQDFRKSEAFLSTYKDVFGEDFSLREKKPTPESKIEEQKEIADQEHAADQLTRGADD